MNCRVRSFFSIAQAAFLTVAAWVLLCAMGCGVNRSPASFDATTDAVSRAWNHTDTAKDLVKQSLPHVDSVGAALLGSVQIALDSVKVDLGDATDADRLQAKKLIAETKKYDDLRNDWFVVAAIWLKRLLIGAFVLTVVGYILTLFLPGVGISGVIGTGLAHILPFAGLIRDRKGL